MKKHTCCFIGHGPDKLFEHLDESQVLNKIMHTVTDAILDGYSIFMCAGNRGGDFLFAEAVNLLKSSYPDIRLEFILPYRGQAEGWDREDRDHYSALLNCADRVICLNDKLTATGVQICSRTLIECSSLVIAAWNGSDGNTAYAYNYAKKNKYRIIDVFERQLEQTDQLSFL